MTFNTLSKGYKALLLVGSASAFTLATPAYAQDQDEDEAAPGQQIIVTGSRIQRPDYENNSPTVSVDSEFLSQGSSAAIEQQLNKLPQFVVSQSSTVKNNDGGLSSAAADVQPNSTNTPGAATISLRGVGANRTLVLIDGRRGTPGNASGTVDISTIPSSAIERVEIVSGGASATYGADAVAGVTNFILKKDFQGLELDAQASINQYGDGFEYQLSGIMGSDFDDGRGNVTFAMSTNSRNVVMERDRSWFRDLWNNPDAGGNVFFINRPSISLQAQAPNADSFFGPGCVTLGNCIVTDYFANPANGGPANPLVPNDTTAIFVNADGTLFTGAYDGRGGAAFFKPGNDFYTDAFTEYGLTSAGVLKGNITNNQLSTPLTRYSFYGRGNYEINDWIGVFAQGMFSHTNTFTKAAPDYITFGTSVHVPWGSGTYKGNIAVPSSVLADGVTTNPIFQAKFPYLNCAGYITNVGGCTNTEAFQQVVPDDLQGILDGRTDPNGNIQLVAGLPDPRTATTDVMTYNMVAGFEGLIPGSDWTWDISVNHGVSQTTSNQTGIYSLERLRAVVGSPNFGQGFSYTGNALDAGFGAGTGICTSGFDFFNVQGNANNVSDDCRQAIRADLNNKGKMRQTIVEANMQGKLLDLPAGELRGAVGASYRRQHYTFNNDGLLQKDRSFLDKAIGIFPAGDTDGEINVKEVYAELLIPVLSDIPGIRQFNIELGGRLSDYNTTGSSKTFKVLGDLQVTDWLRFRGGFNRAERAPNVAELFLSPQQSASVDPIGDLCANDPVQTNASSANPIANPTGAADVQAVCMALMTRDNTGGATPPDGNGDGIPDYVFYGDFAFLQASFAAPGGSAWPTVAGNNYYRDKVDPTAAPLEPEVADTWTVGMVLNGPTDSGPLSRLRLSVDYFNITINQPIGALSPGGMQQLCLDPNYNSAVTGAAGTDGIAGNADDVTAAAIAALACTLVRRDPDAAGGFLNSSAMLSTFRNDGLVKLSGVDAQIDWSTDLGGGTLFTNLVGNYMLNFKAKELDPNPLIDYAGTTGTGIKGLNYGSSFRYRLFGTLGYSYKGASLALQWQHTPETRNYGQAADRTAAMPDYNLFNLNGSYQLFENVGLRFNVDNLFNRKPTLTNVDTDLSNNAPGSIPGGSYNYLTDLLGRRFSFGANVKF